MSHDDVPRFSRGGARRPSAASFLVLATGLLMLLGSERSAGAASPHRIATVAYASDACAVGLPLSEKSNALPSDSATTTATMCAVQAGDANAPRVGSVRRDAEAKPESTSGIDANAASSRRADAT